MMFSAQIDQLMSQPDGQMYMEAKQRLMQERERMRHDLSESARVLLYDRVVRSYLILSYLILSYMLTQHVAMATSLRLFAGSVMMSHQGDHLVVTSGHESIKAL